MSETPETIDHVDTPETPDAPLVSVNVPKLKATAAKVGRTAAKFAVPVLIIGGLAYVKGASDTLEIEDDEDDEDDTSDSDGSDE